MVSPCLAPKVQSPGLSRPSPPLGTTPLSNHPSIPSIHLFNNYFHNSGYMCQALRMCL